METIKPNETKKRKSPVKRLLPLTFDLPKDVNCDINDFKAELLSLEHVLDKFPNHNWVIGKEVAPTTGMIHFHVGFHHETKQTTINYATLREKLTVTIDGHKVSPKIGDNNGQIFDKWPAWFAYCIKEGEFLTNLAPDCYPKGSKETKKQRKDEGYKEALAQKTKSEFKEKLLEVDPGKSIFSAPSVEFFANQRYGEEEQKYVDDFEHEFLVPQEVKEWFDSYVLKSCHRSPVLILHGETQLGKTAMIRSLGPHSYHSSAWNLKAYLKDLQNGAKYIVLDDPEVSRSMDWSLEDKWWNPKPRVCTDQKNHHNLTDRYHHKVRTKVLPTIIICNYQPLIGDSYWQANCKVLEIRDKCYNPNSNRTGKTSSPVEEEDKNLGKISDDEYDIILDSDCDFAD